MKYNEQKQGDFFYELSLNKFLVKAGISWKFLASNNAGGKKRKEKNDR